MYAASRGGSLNDRGIAFDLRTAAQSVEAALSSGIGSLIKFSVIEGFVMPGFRRRNSVVLLLKTAINSWP